MKPLQNKRALIFGVANERSLAWAIAQHLHAAGAEVGFSYLNERLERRVRPLAESLDSKIILPCDVSDRAQVEKFFSQVGDIWSDGFDILIHSLAFANTTELEGRFVDTSREGFNMALSISAFSLVELTKFSEPAFEKRGGGRVLTLSHYGAEKVIPNYNVMGVAKAALEACVRYLASDLGTKKITVNAISAGPVKTLAAAGIKGFKSMLEAAGEKTPLRENIAADDVGAMAAFLSGPGGAHVTGTTMYVDSGAHVMGA